MESAPLWRRLKQWEIPPYCSLPEDSREGPWFELLSDPQGVVTAAITTEPSVDPI